MWYQFLNFSGNLGLLDQVMGWIWPFVFLDLILKGFALWRSARSGQKWWFVALLLINSLGILPGIYLLTHPKPKSGRNK